MNQGAYSHSENIETFNFALVILSKIITRYGPDIFLSANRQKLRGLISDLFPQDNDVYPKLKEALSCNFTQRLLETADKGEFEKEDAFRKTVEVLVKETELNTDEAVLIARLIAYSLGWEIKIAAESGSQGILSDGTRRKKNASCTEIAVQKDAQTVALSVKAVSKSYFIRGLHEYDARNYESAVYWFTKGAECGNDKAQSYLGRCYYAGEGIEQDLNLAAYWWQKSAEQGNAVAQCMLGLCYHNGDGVEKNLEQAAYWSQKSAEQGYAGGQFSLGLCYYTGEGVEKNLDQAAYWSQKAAEQGDASAQYILGRCYYNGEGVPENLGQAFYWFQKSAEQGCADAQFSLGLCCYDGAGVERNLEQAFYWWQKSADQGNVLAQGILKKIKEIAENNLDG